MSAVLESALPRRRLLRVLGLAFGLAVVVGETVGVGIMRTSGPTAGRLAEPWLIYLVWLGVGTYVLMIADILAELATAMPSAGGPYIYVRRAYGDYLGFVCGWSDYAVYVLAVGYLAIAASEFLAEIWPGLRPFEAPIASASIVLFAGFNSLGLRASSTAQQILSLLKVLMLAALIVAAFTYSGSPSHASHAAPVVAGGIGFVAIVVSMQTVLEVYGGFNSPCYFSEETTNPDRTVPRALLLGVLLVLGIYLAVNAALLHILSPSALGSSKLAAADALATAFGPSARVAVAIIALVATLGVLNACVLLAPRVLYGMGRDGLFASSGTYVTRQGVPIIGTWVSAAAAIVVANVGGFDTLYTAAAFLNGCGFLLCAAALFTLRSREPDLRRPHRAFGYPWAPGIALLVSGLMLLAFIIGNTFPSLLAVAVVAATYPIFRVVQRKRSGAQRST
ncbi:MAG TPA: APC family permease [Steroidobacteraceae bacterium]|nr:APC family permease [Steroidobacteraceae bacterium]